MGQHDSGQIATDAARVYDEFFLPALFAEWPARVIAAAGAKAGDRVIDVGCGTGVLTLTAREAVGAAGRVAGVDINPGMLAVARAKSSSIEWRETPAEALPFSDNDFDCAVSQFALMFFDDRRKAIDELRRVVRPEGRIALAVWGALEDTPGYAAMATLLADLFGEEVARSMRAPYALGDIDVLRSTLDDLGIGTVDIETPVGTARFRSLEDWVHTDIRGWTLADVIDDAQYASLLEAACDRLSCFARDDGSIEFDAPAHIVVFDA